MTSNIFHASINRYDFQTMYLTSLLLLLVSCTAQPRMHHSLLQSAKGRGPIAVSAENPFLVGNKILTLEMERSEELAGFIERRGGPAAIEVRRELFSALELTLYYPENNELYQVLETSDLWLIEGPSEIPSEKRAELMQVIGSIKIDADQFEPPPSLASPHVAGDPLTVIPHSDIERREGVIDSRDAARSPLALSKTIEELNRKYQLREAGLSSRGDLQHIVTDHGENTGIIALWFTHDESNSARIARINQLKEGVSLQPGSEITIPSYLLKTRTQPSREALDEFVAGIGSHDL